MFEKIQLKRLKEKGFLKNEAQRRINAQFSQDKKQERSGFIIDNSGAKEKTKGQVLDRLNQLAQLSHIRHSFFYKEH